MKKFFSVLLPIVFFFAFNSCFSNDGYRENKIVVGKKDFAQIRNVFETTDFFSLVDGNTNALTLIEPFVVWNAELPTRQKQLNIVNTIEKETTAMPGFPGYMTTQTPYGWAIGKFGSLVRYDLKSNKLTSDKGYAGIYFKETDSCICKTNGDPVEYKYHLANFNVKTKKEMWNEYNNSFDMFIIDNSIISVNMQGEVRKSDIQSGKDIWVIKPKSGLETKISLANGYLWIEIDNISKGKFEWYRIDPKSGKVLKVILENVIGISAFGDKTCMVSDNGRMISIFNPQTGEVSEHIELIKIIENAVAERHIELINNCVVVKQANGYFLFDLKEKKIVKQIEGNPVRVRESLSEVSDYYLDAKDKYIGLNPNTGEYTWEILKDENNKNSSIVLSDDNGVIIENAEYILIYR